METIFVLLPLMVITGMAMSPWLNALWPGWVDLLGGRQSARALHFIVAWLLVLFALVCLQATIGILTLVWQVPLTWALAHQGGALVVLGFAVAHWRGFYGEYPREIADG